jgi:hypothetical protein
MTPECNESPTPAPRSNLYLNLATALTASALVGTRWLLRFTLRPDDRWLGLGRHTWMHVHLGIAAVLAGLVIVHLVRHRAGIARRLGEYFGPLRSVRVGVTCVLGIAFLLLPLLVPAQSAGGGRRVHGDRARHGLEWRPGPASARSAMAHRGGWR